MSTTYPCAGVQTTINEFSPTARIAPEQTKYSTASILLIGNAAGQVSQDGGKNTPIRVARNAHVDLCFEVQSPDDQVGKPAYNPVGVSFFSAEGDLGLEDFPTRTVAVDPFNRLLLTVHDANVYGRHYKFNLVIQKVATGEIGVIDPQINNS